MLDKFPYEHCVDCINNTVYLSWNDGQIGRYSIPILVERFYPGYKGKLVTLEYLGTLRNQLAN